MDCHHRHSHEGRALSKPMEAVDLTVRERVLIHLRSLPNDVAAHGSDARHTQAGIAVGVDISRKHVPRVLRGLMDESILSESMGRVEGGRQRQRMYALTVSGRVEADALAEATGVDELVPRERGEDEQTARAKAAEVLRMMLRRAWSDGRITIDEQSLINDVAIAYRINPSTVMEITNAERDSALSGTGRDGGEIYRELIRLGITEDLLHPGGDHPMLKGLRKVFAIPEDDHQTILAREAMVIGSVSDGRLLTFLSALEAAWSDGEVSDDEEAILANLRSCLNITSNEERALMEEVRERLT